MPEDIHDWMWRRVCALIEAGSIAVTTEIYEEMGHIRGLVGECISTNRGLLVLEVGDYGWDWPAYVEHVKTLQITHRNYISEYSSGSARTISLNDMSIIALSKTLGLPMVSMEAPVRDLASSKRKIPNICQAEGVEHLGFNDFLRREGIRR